LWYWPANRAEGRVVEVRSAMFSHGVSKMSTVVVTAAAGTPS
jgi:hypothetical protein